MSCRNRARIGVEIGLWLAASLCAAAPCRAEGRWSGSVAATSDYVFRGVLQTYDGGALQAGLNYQDPTGWFAGAWASNVEPYPFGSRAAEIDVYAGFAWALSPQWTARARYARYLYTWDRRRRPYDYGELALTLGFEDRLSATIAWLPDDTRYATPGYVRDRRSLAYELTARWPLGQRFALVAGAGYYDLKRLYGVGYWSGSAGLSYGYRRLELDFTRFVGDRTVRRLFEEASADGRWVASATYRF